MDVKILDCTLRDGGYVNNWEFGEKAILDIVSNLVKAKVDIIECGFLKNVPYDKDFSVFNSVENIEKIIAPKNNNSMYVAMVKFGANEIEPDKIPDYNGDSLDGIRVIFQKDNIDSAIDYCKKIKEKGYKVFMQPVKISFYDEKTLLDLIDKVNVLSPYAFYIVDTFGSMKEDDLIKLFRFVDENLKDSIKIGFHSHNNLQLSYANTIALLGIKTQREIIIDSSVYGMGRGAGNLSTETIMQFVNDNMGGKYSIPPLLNIYDKYLVKIYDKTPWGYSLPYFLSATYSCHPNYATYLAGKNIGIEIIDSILSSIPQEKKLKYDDKLVENLYLKILN